jgi:tripartite ATP-independent transporter DctP family solute receptor
MMLKKFRYLALLMALILVFISGTTFAAKKPLKLTYGNVYPPDHYYVKADQYFKELVEKNSKGQILVDYFPGGQLGNAVEMEQAVMSGAIQLYFSGPLWRYYSKVIVFELPYIYRDEAHQQKVADRFNSLIDEDEYAAKAGVRTIGTRLSSARNLCTKFPVYKLEDIKGLKVRVPESNQYIATWKALGAIPTSIPGPDQYTALATGVVDAAENPFADIYSWKYQENLKYCALTGHVRAIYAMSINDKFWKSLTARQRKIISKAALASCKYSETLRKKSEGEYKKLLAKGGMKFTTPNTAPFRERAKTIWSQFADAEMIKKIEAVK